MQSSNLYGFTVVVLPICLDCGQPNFSYLDRCTSCGSSLISSDPPVNIDQPLPYCASQDFPQVNFITSYFPCNYEDNQHLVIQNNQMDLLLERTISPKQSQKPMPHISIQNAPDTLATNAHMPAESCLKTSANQPTEGAYQSLPFIPNKQMNFRPNFPHRPRHRSISGPCDNVLNNQQHFRSALRRYDSLSYPFISDSSISPHFFVSIQNTSSPSTYSHSVGSAVKSVNQRAALFIDSCSASQPSVNSLRLQLNDDRINHQLRDFRHPNKMLSQNQRQACSFRSVESRKRFGKNNADTYVHQTVPRQFQPPAQISSATTGRHQNPQECSSNIGNQPSIVGNLPPNDTPYESTFPDSLNRSSFASTENGHTSCDDNAPRNPNWLGLPTELWLNIIRLLTYTDRASLVQTCSKLSDIVAHRCNWRVIRLDRYHHLTDSRLAMIGLKKPRQLHFTYCRGDAVTSRGIDQLFKNCGESLESFSFTGCSKGIFQSDYPLLASTLYCPNLCHIDASNANTVRDQTVRAIAQRTATLRTLLLNGAQQISNSAIKHLVRHHKHTLERLELFGCFHLNSKIFTALGECHGLRALAFGFLHHLSSNGLLELVSKLPLLVSLDLRGTQKLVTDKILSRLAKDCPLLEEVVLANMSPLTREDGVVTMLNQLPRLRVLDVCGLAVVGDNTLQALATNCPLLEELDISCTSVTEVGLLCMANAPAVSLKSLRISFCPRITATSIEKLVTSCLKLSHLSLYGCSWTEKWDFPLKLRSNLVIQTEAQCIKSTAE